jgi:hypothetical protein
MHDLMSKSQNNYAESLDQNFKYLQMLPWLMMLYFDKPIIS